MVNCVLFVIVVYVTCAHAFEGCSVHYDRKGCEHRIVEGVLVICDGHKSEGKIPTNVPKAVVYLSLINFKLHHLKKADFAMFTRVECLYIMDSGISKIDADAFSAMESLAELTLEKTHIDSTSLSFVNHESFEPQLLSITHNRFLERIDFDATKNLNELKTLNLAHNHISQINPAIWDELKVLEALDLGGNRLVTLDWESLRELRALNELHLNDNRFQRIPESMFSVFFAVKELTLAGNRLHCNCQLRWLRDFLRESVFDKSVDIIDIECASPFVRRFTDLDSSDFVCSQPSVPHVKYAQFDDMRYELNCTSYGDPSPTLFLTLPDGRTVITPPSDDLSELKPLTPQIVARHGHVTCEARNSIGRKVHASDLPLPALDYSGATCLTPASLLQALLTLLCYLYARF